MADMYKVILESKSRKIWYTGWRCDRV